MEKRLLLGDEAVALGALHAGLSGVYAYPGTPSTEITEYIQGSALARERGVHSRWCTNEKTAMEAALGMSYAGKRAMVCMKHVGMNVCADAFINSAITGAHGGLVVVAADDPSMHSSQNEQDSRFYGKFALVPVFEPSTQQEAYDMMAAAFDYSEAIKEPVLLRLVTRLSHSRAGVVVADGAREANPLSPSTDAWVLLPGIAKRKYAALLDKQDGMLMEACKSPWNTSDYGTAQEKKAKIGVVACGIAYNYVMEALQGLDPRARSIYNIEKISQYPLPAPRIEMLARESGRLIVVEDGQPVVEEAVRGILGKDYPVEGRLTGALPRTGELTPDAVAAALTQGAAVAAPREACPIVAARPPQLCQGCGHRDVYAALNRVAEEYPDHRIFGDIGCYTLGALPPFKALSSCVDMGASITMAKGAADAGLFPAIAVIGDSTFTHSGMTGLLDAVNDKSNIVVVISDNLTTGMTGGQDSAGTSKYEAICTGLGVEPEHVRVVVPLPKNMDEITRIVREEIEYNGVSVIIPRRECIQTLRRHSKK